MTRKTIRRKKTSKKTMRRKSHGLPSPIEKASQKYVKTGFLKKAHTIFKAQALANARKLFGYNVRTG